MLTQNKRSMDEVGCHCLYYGDAGAKCAAGCLIADDEYKSSFEQQTWGDLVSAKDVPKEHSDLIEHLQSIHDDYDIENWKSALTELADDYNLNTDNAIFTK